MVKTYVKFQKNPNITVGEVVCTRDPLSIHFHCVNVEKVSKLKLRKKVSKINLRIISEPHANLQSMVKTSVKYQKNLNITVGGVACTRYPLSIHFYCQNVRKNDLSSNCKKSVKN